jgi:hypothetical protein
MTQNLLQGAQQTAVGLQGLRQLRNQEQQQLQQQQRNDQQYTQQQDSMARINELKSQYGETGDPAVMRQLILEDPQFAQQINQQFGALDDDSKMQSMNEAATLKLMLEKNPDEAMNYWQQNLAQNQAFAGLADNFQAGDFEGAMNEIGFGVTALGGQDAYNKLFAQTQDATPFIKDLEAAGIKRGSEEFKQAVLEKYGKGQTIGYDVVEGMNPETGKNEYFQVSRVNPGEKIPLGVEVPVSAQQLKTEAANAAAQDKEKDTFESTLTTVQKILTSPGLSGFSGLDSFRRFIPGSEAANVGAWIDQLQSQNFLTAVTQMKGMGALSENEGKKLSASVAAIDSKMSDAAILRELQSIESDLLAGLERIESGNLLDVKEQKGVAGITQSEATQTKTTVNWSDM